MPANFDRHYRVEILRALAYLFLHPEIESHVDHIWNPVDDPPGTRTYKFSVDERIMEVTMIRLQAADREERTRRGQR